MWLMTWSVDRVKASGCLSILLSSQSYMRVALDLADWVDEQLPATNILRLIYQGRFLHGNVTLGGEYLNSDGWETDLGSASPAFQPFFQYFIPGIGTGL